jgi:hypothetical protein
VLDQLDQAATEYTPAPPAYVSNGQPLGPQIDALFDLREKKREHEAAAREIEEIIEAKSIVIMAELNAQGLDKATGHKARIGISVSVVPQVEDWDKFYAFIRRNNAFELLERRPSAGAFREHAAARRDKTVPGAVPYVKRKLSLTVNT